MGREDVTSRGGREPAGREVEQPTRTQQLKYVVERSRRSHNHYRGSGPEGDYEGTEIIDDIRIETVLLEIPVPDSVPVYVPVPVPPPVIADPPKSGMRKWVILVSVLGIVLFLEKTGFGKKLVESTFEALHILEIVRMLV